MSVKPSPVVPAPAATLVLLRDRSAGGFELLLIQRHRASKFAAGDYVFPGGKVAADDSPDDPTAWCAGLDVTDAASTLGLETAPRTALGYWIGAIRETFEEVGILLAYDASGQWVRLDPGVSAAARVACHKDNRAFRDLLAAERLTLATDRLRYFAHWITPEENPLRFDTRFFVAMAPPDQDAVADEHEIIDVRWLGPREALETFKRGEISLRRPTVENIKLVSGLAATGEPAETAQAAIDALAGRTIPTIRPRVVTENGKPRPIMPGEPGWY
ncbi:MAG: hypothetical protein HY294_08915 [Candidatus Rokubacteria bacterium]|nr:hypothetical protein [Candidatus Rokubacteria bacterium]MBI3826105.1 hypothetical protein [Candidatus Rokubacteria bacterium]